MATRQTIPAVICLCIVVLLFGFIWTRHVHGDSEARQAKEAAHAVNMLSFKYASTHTLVGSDGKVGFKPTMKPAVVVPAPPEPLPDYLHNTAIVTMATGDDAAKLAVALVQSLRDVKTRVPNIVVLLSRGGLGSEDCKSSEWKKAHGREEIDCAGPHVVEEEIISEQYVTALRKLGAHLQMIDPIPDTPFTVIPGGRQIFWGMAFNKLRVFNMTEYRKLLWMDSDTLALRNFDTVLQHPMFTAAFTYDCCNQNSPAKPSGGMWVVEPSRRVMNQVMKLIAGPVPGTNDPWHWGDMQVVRYLFGAPPPAKSAEPYWPAVNDGRHGYVQGLRIFPEYAAMSDAQFQAFMDERLRVDIQRVEGFNNATWDGKRPPWVWKMLDPRYDQCVGMCECLPGRDMPRTSLTVHFSCIRYVEKPSRYESERKFMEALYRHALSCTRYYYMVWYEKFKKAAGRLPGPYWTGPPIPLYNSTHDEIVRARRIADGL